MSVMVVIDLGVVNKMRLEEDVLKEKNWYWWVMDVVLIWWIDNGNGRNDKAEICKKRLSWYLRGSRNGSECDMLMV